MKKLFILLTATIIFFSCDKEENENNDNQNDNPPAHAWEQVAEFPGGEREHATSFALDGYGYVGLGVSTSTGSYKDFYRYDPQNNSWQQISDFPGEARYTAICFTIDGYAYVGAGSQGTTHLNDFWKYDPVNDSWSEVASFEGNSGGYNKSVTVNSKGYALFQTYGRLYEYDPVSDSWTKKADFPKEANIAPSCFPLEGKLYTVAGCHSASISNSYYHKEVYEYDPGNDQWTQKSDFAGKKRYKAVGFNIGNYGFVATGSAELDYDMYALNDTWCYDQDIDKWFQMEDMPLTEPSLLESFVIGDTAYVGGGKINSGTFNSSYNKSYFRLYKQ